MEPKSFYRKGGLNHVEYRPGRAEFSTPGGAACSPGAPGLFWKRSLGSYRRRPFVPFSPQRAGTINGFVGCRRRTRDPSTRSPGASSQPHTVRSVTGALRHSPGLSRRAGTVRYFMHEAALSVDIDPRRLSFIHAVRVLRETAPLMRAAAAERLPFLYAAIRPRRRATRSAGVPCQAAMQ